ncbi:MAG: Fic family protein [Acidobacteriota bacterium]|nr:Fic family protein [Acidobacteriota bacterium]
MIEEADFPIPGTAVPRNKLGITDLSQLNRAEADFSAYRLVELQCSPIRGSFDTAHLQNIHHYIYQDLYDWAGELRVADRDRLQQSLDKTLDGLGADNHLRALSEHEWTAEATGYVYKLRALQPFVRGNEIVLREFAVELAAKNQVGLRWDAATALSTEAASALVQQEAQSASLRRLIMLAMDKDASPLRPNRGDRFETTLERTANFGASLL